jgi:AraC-like DNA-binding protein
MLRHINNWPERARTANWSSLLLAKKCNVSLRTLERYFLKEHSKSLHSWLCNDQQQQAIVLLQNGASIKEVAASLGYKHSTNFSRKFKKFWGYPPTFHSVRQLEVS